MEPFGPNTTQALPPEILQLLKILAPAMGAGSQTLLSAPVTQVAPKMSPVGIAPQVPGPAAPAPAPGLFAPGADKLNLFGPGEGKMNFDVGDWAQNWGETWSDPEKLSQWPMGRSPDQSALHNTAAGMFNTVANAPQGIWQLYENLIGKPFADFALTPENKKGGAAAAAPNPTAGFTPGMPKPQGGAPAGAPGYVDKVAGIESGGNNTARNPTSSAYGAGQFIKSTWLDFIREAHPELQDYMTKGEILELRSDPEYSREAIGWMASKGVDALDSVDAPATDTNLYLHHFLGAGGVKALLTADPNAQVSTVLEGSQIAANKTILGGARTVQDVIDWAANKTGEYAGAGPPPVPRPPISIPNYSGADQWYDQTTPQPRPAVVGPDFTAANNWYDQAAPTPVDPTQLQNAQLAAMLAGIGKGLGSVDAQYDGGGALFGALAAGSGEGAQAGQKLELDYAEQFKTQQQAYSTLRGGVSENQAITTANTTNANSENDWLDSSDLATYAGKRGDVASTRALEIATVKEKNLEGQWSNAVDQRDYKIAQGDAQRKKRADDILTSTPKILQTDSKGMTIQTPEGGVIRHDFDSSAKWDEIEAMTKALGADNTLVRGQKYTTMAQAGTNILSMEAEIIKDLLNDGMGLSIWGDGLADFQAAAEEQVPGTLTGADRMKEVNKSMVGLLLGASQASGNFAWLIQAAALGNPGAQMLVQEGDIPANE